MAKIKVFKIKKNMKEIKKIEKWYFCFLFLFGCLTDTVIYWSSTIKEVSSGRRASRLTNVKAPY